MSKKSKKNTVEALITRAKKHSDKLQKKRDAGEILENDEKVYTHFHRKKPENEALYKLGQSIAAARLERNITQKTLGEMIGMNQVYISLLENGKVNVTAKTILKISKAFGTDASIVFKPKPSNLT